MNLIEIKIFMEELEKTLKAMGFFVEENDDIYICKYKNEQCAIIPFIADTELLPESLQKYEHFLIVGKKYADLVCLKYKHISVEELKKILELKEKYEDEFNRIVEYVFLDYNLSSLIEKATYNFDVVNDDMMKDNLACKNIEAIDNERAEQSSRIDIGVVEKYLAETLQKKGKIYSNSKTGVVSVISKNYEKTWNYWYGYQDYQVELLKQFEKSYMAYYFKDRCEVLLVPYEIMEEYRPYFNSSTNEHGRKYWHIHLRFIGKRCFLRIPNIEALDVTKYLINSDKAHFEEKTSLEANEDCIKIGTNKTCVISIKNK